MGESDEAATMILNKMGHGGKRCRMTMQQIGTNEQVDHSHGIVAHFPKTNKYKLNTMVNKKLNCVQKNYQLDEQSKKTLFEQDKDQAKAFKAPDNFEPVIYKI